MALLGALVLLVLSAALVTATVSAAHAMRRAALSTRARARVEAGVRRAFAEVLVQWSVALDSMPIGAGAYVALDSEPASDGLPLIRTARVERTAGDVYAVTVDVRAFTWDHPLAQRRARLWLERPPVQQGEGGADAASTAPQFVTPWGLADLY